MKHTAGPITRIVLLSMAFVFLTTTVVSPGGSSISGFGIQSPVVPSGDVPKPSGFMDSMEGSKSTENSLDVLQGHPLLSQYGRIVAYRKGKEGSKTVIHIPDCHAHFPAQKNIAGILSCVVESFEESGSDVVIGVEGAVGALDAGRFQSIPDQEIKQQVADTLLAKGMFSGVEHFCVSNEQKHQVVGVEDPLLYLKNCEYFKKVGLLQETLFSQLDLLRTTVKKRIPQYLSLRQALYLVDWEAFHTEKLGLCEYVAKLQEYAQGDFSERACPFPTTQWVQPFFTVFAAALQHRNTAAHRNRGVIRDFRLLPESLSKVVDILQQEKELPMELVEAEARQFTGIMLQEGRADADDLRRMAFDGGLRADESRMLLVALWDKARQAGIVRSKFPQLARYIYLIQCFNSLDITHVQQEIASFEATLQAKIFVSRAERFISLASQWLTYSMRMCQLQISRGEFGQYQACKRAMMDMVPRCEQLTGIQWILHQVETVEEFFVTALARDKAMLSRLVSSVQQRDASCGVLVAGGFHRQGVEDLVWEDGYSHIVIVPHLGGKMDTLHEGSTLFDASVMHYLTIMQTSLDSWKSWASFATSRLAPPLALGQPMWWFQREKRGMVDFFALMMMYVQVSLRYKGDFAAAAWSRFLQRWHKNFFSQCAKYSYAPDWFAKQGKEFTRFLGQAEIEKLEGSDCQSVVRQVVPGRESVRGHMITQRKTGKQYLVLIGPSIKTMYSAQALRSSVYQTSMHGQQAVVVDMKRWNPYHIWKQRLFRQFYPLHLLGRTKEGQESVT